MPHSNSSGGVAENVSENENGLSSSQEIIISEITEYFQGRIAKDINDMAGHIINTMNNSKNENLLSKDICYELEKYKYLIKIQQSIIHITNQMNNSYLKY
ncbi:uncharacterized protein isoform X2 [Rhodnius prolixus]|uniref:uncharacterized protein isoform X2 n=1 Tax=Rhodnius prolixus TaxID=13249 RepID=UPI003D18BA2F